MQRHDPIMSKLELLAYKVKRKFFAISEIESESPKGIEVYEFEGQNFKLVEN